MTPEIILKALEHDMQEKGYPATYIGRCEILPELYALAIHGTPNNPTNKPRPLTIGSWETAPHIINLASPDWTITLASPDWTITLADPNSIPKLYTEINKRINMPKPLPIMEALTQEFRERTYIASHDKTDTQDRITITNPELTRTISIHTNKETPHLIHLTRPTQTINLADPNSIPTLQQAIRDRFANAL